MNKNQDKKDTTRPIKRYEEILNKKESTPPSQFEDSESDTVYKESSQNQNGRISKTKELPHQRLDFIHQSLGSKESAVGPRVFEELQPTFPKKVIPKFLATKKTTEPSRTSPHGTPTKKLFNNFESGNKTPKN